MGGVAGLLEHAPVEGEPAQLAVEEARASLRRFRARGIVGRRERDRLAHQPACLARRISPFSSSARFASGTVIRRWCESITRSRRSTIMQHRHIAAFDPRDQIIGELGRSGDAAVAEQFEDELAEQRVVRRADLDLRASRRGASAGREALIAQAGGGPSATISSGRRAACASFQAWNSASSSCSSALSNSRPPVLRTKIRPSRLRPDLRGPVTRVAMTGQSDQRVRCSNGGAVRVGQQEILVPVRHRPVEAEARSAGRRASARDPQRVAVHHRDAPALGAERGGEGGGVAGIAHAPSPRCRRARGWW